MESSKGSLRYDTWEERAFAEDSAGDLGSIWPPRSYSCSFCGREFRSAQALGGHMNVHRRDRARLKLSQASTSDEEKEDRIPSSGRTIPRVSSWSLRSTVLGDRMFPSSPSWSPLGRKHEENKDMSSLLSRSLLETQGNTSDISSVNKVRCIIGTSGKYSMDETTSHKRARISDSCKLPRFALDLFFTDDCLRKSEVSRVKVVPMEDLDLDLELRLGSPPEVK